MLTELQKADQNCFKAPDYNRAPAGGVNCLDIFSYRNNIAYRALTGGKKCLQSSSKRNNTAYRAATGGIKLLIKIAVTYRAPARRIKSLTQLQPEE